MRADRTKHLCLPAPGIEPGDALSPLPTTSGLCPSAHYIGLTLVIAAFFCLMGCSVMDSMKSAATEMTVSAPAVGPYDPPPASPWQPQSQTATVPPVVSGPPSKAAAPASAVTAAPVVRRPERLPEPAYTPIPP